MKNYARIFKCIMANQERIEDEALNVDPEFVNKMQELLTSLSWLEYVWFEEFLAEGKTLQDFADYIRDNSKEVAEHIMAMAFRKMRHPSRSKELRVFCVEDDED